MEELFTAEEILEYADTCGNDAASGLLLLAGPDSFDGDYDEYMQLYAKLVGGVIC